MTTMRTALSTAWLAALMLTGAGSAATPQERRPDPNWTLVCSGHNCRPEAVTQMPDGREILRMWVDLGPDRTPFLGAIVPLGLHIPNGAALSFDDGLTADYQLRLLSCHAAGCRAVAALDPALQQRLRSASEVAVVIRDSETRSNLALIMPLWGFSATFDQLTMR